MAKKKKSDKAAAEPQKDKPATAGKVTSPSNNPADRAFAAGNYAAVRVLAQGNSDEAKKLLPLTTVDMGQVYVGIVALVVVSIVAFFTLHH